MRENTSSLLIPGGDTVEYAYDNLNRKTGMTDSNGVPEYTYNDMSRLAKVSDDAGGSSRGKPGRSRLLLL